MQNNFTNTVFASKIMFLIINASHCHNYVCMYVCIVISGQMAKLPPPPPTFPKDLSDDMAGTVDEIIRHFDRNSSAISAMPGRVLCKIFILISRDSNSGLACQVPATGTPSLRPLPAPTSVSLTSK